MGTLWNDLRFAGRTLRKSPLFTAVAIISLGLGIGANTAIFTVLDQVLLRLLPVKDPQQLVLLSMVGFHYGSNWGGNALSYPMYQDFAQNNSVFTGMFCRFPYQFSLGAAGRTERVRGELVSGTYFPVLGIGAAAGRTFTPDDDKTPGGHPLAVLSFPYWKGRFNGDPSIIGQDVVINSRNMKVIGVAQPGFEGVELGYSTQVFVPVAMAEQVIPDWRAMKNRRQRWVNTFGRLKPGITQQEAKTSLQPFFHSMLEMEVKEAAFRNASAEVRERFLKNFIDVLPGSQGRSYLRRQLTTPLWVLMAITAGVLLIACANVASLLVAKATARQKEIAIRLAMGANRLRIIQQLLVESLLLSTLGGLLGLAIAIATDKALMRLLPPESGLLQIKLTPDLRVLLFTFAVSVLTGLVFGLIPALQSTKPDVAPTLKDQVGGIVGAASAQVQLRKALVAAQVTVSLLLLIGAGLFIRSLRNLTDLGPGFPSENLVAFNVNPSLNGYDGEKAKVFYQALTNSVASIPGVRNTGLASMRILEDNEWDSWMTIEGYHPAAREVPMAYMNSVSPGYFDVLGVPILCGRDFTLKDTANVQHGDKPDDRVPRVAIVNEKWAKKYFGTAPNALGRHAGFGIDPNTKMDMEIIGVVKDIKYTNLRDEIPPQMFLPYLAGQRVGGMTMYARTSMDATQFFSVVRSKVQEIDSNLPLYGMRTIDAQISNSLLTERMIAALSTVFGCLATLLATIGLYGVMAYTVARRTREIGIRMALGAFQMQVIWMVMQEVVVLVALGSAAGIAFSFGLTRFAQTQLYGLSAHDPATMGSATLLLAVIACAAGYIPAMRASRIEAMHALRYE